MDTEKPELIEQEMAATRESLVSKVAALEQQVTGTIQSATETVSGTVEAVKAAVTETVSTVRETVQESMSTVKEQVSDSVHTVADTMKSAFNVSDRVRENPWAFVGGSTLAGFVTGLVVFRHKSGQLPMQGLIGHPTAAHPTPAAAASYAAVERRPEPEPAKPAAPKQPSWLDKLFERAGDELRRLGEQAIDQATASLKRSVDQELPKLLDQGIPKLLTGVMGAVGMADQPKPEPHPNAGAPGYGSVYGSRVGGG